MSSNISDMYKRNELIWGKDFQAYLFTRHVVVCGLGGVGSYAAEALARSGVGELTIIDFDEVAESNINRQLPALLNTVGQLKADIMKDRILQINSEIKVNAIKDFCNESLVEELLDKNVHFVVDAIDTLRSKIDLIDISYKKNIPIVTSLGAGNRMCPEKLYLADISEVNAKKCPFARNIKYKLKKRGIEKNIAVVASDEKPFAIEKQLSEVEYINNFGEKIHFKKFSPGSTPFVPPVAGYIMASYVVRTLLSGQKS